jgi:DNA polymerase elongation subunit (family B)
MIEIDGSQFNDFKQFLKQDNLQWFTSPSPNGDWYLVTVPTTEQTFKLNSALFQKLEDSYDPITHEHQYDAIIFGKDSTENVVNIDVKDDGQVILYKEVNGALVPETRKFCPWILTNRAITENSQKLEGHQYYKWITEFETVDAWQKTKNQLRKKHHSDGFMYVANYLKENFMMRHGVTYFKNMKPREISILSFDIESNGLTMNEDSKTFLISNTYRCGDKVVKKLFDIFDYNCNDQDMIDAWCEWVNEMNPSFLLGHNVVSYDLKWLDHCSRSGLKIGRDGSKLDFATYPSEFRKDGSQSYEYNKVKINGREVIDSFFMSIHYDIGRKYESYGLKVIIKHEGLEKHGRSFVDASKIKEVYYRIIASNFKDQEALKEWENIRAYAIDDSDDSLKLFDLMSPTFFYPTQSVPKSFQAMNESATGSQINSLLVRNYLQDNQSIPKTTETDYVEGGISFAIPGLYRNMIKVDLKSAYPSQVLRFKLYDKQKDPKAYFYYMVKYFTEKRFEYKKLGKETGDVYYKDLDAAAKVFINSAYGVCQTPGLNFNCPHIAAKITEETRKVIEMALVWGSGKGKDYWFKLFNEKVGKEVDNED